ncbi:hypothetical protein KSS87_006658, partial [Heliosperma pusillum]
EDESGRFKFLKPMKGSDSNTLPFFGLDDFGIKRKRHNAAVRIVTFSGFLKFKLQRAPSLLIVIVIVIIIIIIIIIVVVVVVVVGGGVVVAAAAAVSYDRLPAAALKGIGFNGILFEKPDSLALSVMPIMKPKKIIQVFQGYNFVMAGWQRALSLLIVIVIVAVAVAVVVAVAAAAAVAFAVAVVVTAAATVSYDRLPAAALKGIGFNGICKWTHLFWWKHY